MASEPTRFAYAVDGDHTVLSSIEDASERVAMVMFTRHSSLYVQEAIRIADVGTKRSISEFVSECVARQ